MDYVVYPVESIKYGSIFQKVISFASVVLKIYVSPQRKNKKKYFSDFSHVFTIYKVLCTGRTA